jgi:hypothetical protein
VISFTLRPLYPRGNISWYQLDRSLGGLQSRSGHCGAEKNLLSLPGIENRPSSPQPVGIPTELSSLKKKKSNIIQKQAKCDPRSENSAFSSSAKLFRGQIKFASKWGHAFFSSVLPNTIGRLNLRRNFADFVNMITKYPLSLTSDRC